MEEINVKEELNLEEIDTEIEENIVESSEISIQSLENTIVHISLNCAESPLFPSANSFAIV